MRVLHLAAVILSVPVLSAQDRQGQWAISDQPLISVGAVDGSGPDVFGSIWTAVRQESGAMMVVDGTTLKFFDVSGRFSKSAGRLGSGPGEFRSVKSARLCAGDSIFVYDPSLMKLSIFTSRGEHVTDIGLHEWMPAPPYDFWCNRTGTLVFMHRSTSPPSGIGPRRPAVVISLATTDSLSSRLGTFPASERYFNGSNDFPRPLGKLTSVAIGRTSVFIGTGEKYEVQVFDLQGRAIRSFAEDRPAVPIERQHLKAYVDRQLESRRGLPNYRSLEQMYGEIEYPETFPAYAGIILDDLNNLWIADYSVPGSKYRHWSIFTEEGRMLARLRVPEAFEILQAGAGYVFGLWRDESGALFVRSYALIRG